MKVPTIHGNGSAQSVLVEQHREATRAVRVAMETLAKASPNARDFYTQGPEAIGEALAEHAARQAKLHAVLDELQDLTRAIARGGHGA